MESMEFQEINNKFCMLSKQLADQMNKMYDLIKADREKLTDKSALYDALAKAKLEYKPVTFNRINTFNKQVYADLDMIEKATRDGLSHNGLVFFQRPEDEDGTTFLYSTLGHSSGQEIVCKSRLIVPGYTGAKSDNQRFGESLAYLKRQVAQCMLSITASHDEEDNDDADTSATQFDKTMRNAVGNSEVPAMVDQGTLSEKINKDQLQELHYELENYPMMYKSLLKGLEIKELADMPKAKYRQNIEMIKRQKAALTESPQKEW